MDEQALADAGRARRLAAVAFALHGDPQSAEAAAVEALSGSRTSLDATGDELRALVRICVSDIRRARLWSALGRSPKDREALDPDRSKVMTALRRLPPRERVAVVLARMEGLDYEGIASALDCSEATARSLLSSGADRLGRVLETDTTALRGMLTAELQRAADDLDSQRALDLGTAARMISLERRRRMITLVGMGAAVVTGAGLIYLWVT
jgi:DNA-directed RNA polymerase specialized sigma24 family protein